MKHRELGKQLRNWGLALGIALALEVLGAALRIPESLERIGCAVGLTGLGLCFLGNVWLSHRFDREHTDRYRQLQMANALREDRRESARMLEKALARAAWESRIYTVLLVLWTAGTCLFLGAFPGGAIVPVYTLQMILERNWPQPKATPPENATPEALCPQLYALAREVQGLFGDRRKLDILHDGGCSATIFAARDRVCLKIGTILQMSLTKEEVYQVLLHEFAHLGTAENLERRVQRIEGGQWFFGITDRYLTWAFSLHKIFASLEAEERADRAILDHGNPQAAASMFAKLACHGYYEGFFLNSGDHLYFHREETPPKAWMRMVCGDFRKAVEGNLSRARELIAGELPMRVGSHPIARQRIAAMGVKDYEIIFPDHQDAWGREMNAILDWSDGEVANMDMEEYRQAREEAWTKPQAAIDGWLAAGKPLTYEATREVMEAFLTFHRYEELLALCRAFEESGASDHERCHAIFLEGVCRLRLGDDRGLALLYKAMELNRNYEDQASDGISRYCLTLGRKEEMEAFRRFADALAEKQVTVQETFPLTPRDTLLADHPDTDIFRENLAVIHKAAGEHLLRVFLVKKITSPETHDYIYILDMAPDTPEEAWERVWNTIFMHLDKQEEQYSLAFYEEDSGRDWLEKRPEFLLWKK